MRQRENRRVYARKFQNEITHAMHAGQERWVWRGRLSQCWECPALHLAYLYIGLWTMLMLQYNSIDCSTFFQQLNSYQVFLSSQTRRPWIYRWCRTADKQCRMHLSNWKEQSPANTSDQAEWPYLATMQLHYQLSLLGKYNYNVKIRLYHRLFGFPIGMRCRR